jgi:hypothetical protein
VYIYHDIYNNNSVLLLLLLLLFLLTYFFDSIVIFVIRVDGLVHIIHNASSAGHTETLALLLASKADVLASTKVVVIIFSFETFSFFVK